MSRPVLILLLALCSVLCIAAALTSGSADITPGSVWGALSGGGDPLLQEIVLELRLPRALAAFGTGAALALAGALMQVLLRNPLADPYVLGTSGGAAVGALLALLIGASTWLVNSAAFVGALFSTLLVFGIVRGSADRAPGRMLLTGVVIAAGWGALITLILALAPPGQLRSMLFWLMGDFSYASQPLPPLLLALVASLAGLALAPTLNILATGDQQAALLGVAVRPVRTVIYLLSSLLTAVAVTTAGTVGFVGLIVPHLIRLVGGSDHRTVMPCAALAGGSLVVLADTVARTILEPRQLPVGAITALIGVPLFLLLLRQSGQQDT